VSSEHSSSPFIESCGRCIAHRFAFARRPAANATFTLTPHEPSLTLRRSQRIARVSRSYREFDHDDASHSAIACASCHKIESVRRIDAVEYPDHDACISCHRQQFFNGARPNICTICHTVVSPRDGSRFKFPKPAVASEFQQYLSS
jgi:hypothetical protein